MPRILDLINFQPSEHKPDGHVGEQQIWLLLVHKTGTRSLEPPNTATAPAVFKGCLCWPELLTNGLTAM